MPPFAVTAILIAIGVLSALWKQETALALLGFLDN